ncbi:dodecin family protein [Thiofilum flexile]|uniref:dodecin family protein n=1 Tax=Thiofilum flexile TaxID=125627 RepID=UPI000380D2B5|nr:dodecin family protein [Thiofilum flexile]
MSVAKIIEISCTSNKSFEDAIQQGITRAEKTLKGVKSAWVADQSVEVKDGKVIEYQTRLKLTFVLE